MNRIPIPDQNETPNQNNVRLREHIGLVTNDTSTTQLCFLISPLKNKASVEKTEYIVFDHPTYGENYQVIAEITDIRGYEEVVGGSITDKTAGNMVATAQIIGYINQKEQTKPIRPLLTPPNPGSRVYIPYADFLENIFMRDVDGQPYTNPICIGEIETTAPVDSENKRPLKFHLNAETLTTTHTLITAKDGEGKTHTARTIAKELADKTQHAIVIMDPYNEYAETVKNPDKPIQIVAPNTDKTAKDASRNVRPNQTTILLAGGLTLKEKRDLYNQHLTMLWKARLEKTAPPFLLIAEDAESLKGETLDEIAYAGTKNGATLLLIAKHPTELGGNILSQTTTQITGRTTDKDDLNYLSNVVGEKTALLPKLKRGQWIISSASTIKPFQIETTET